MSNSRVLLFNGGMDAGEAASTEAGSWFVKADDDGAPARAKRPYRTRRQQDSEKSGRVVIVSSMFLVLVAATALLGGHAAIEPLLRSAVSAHEPEGTSDVVFTMPDGIFCRHMSFDNVTAMVTEGALERCGDDLAEGRPRTIRSFSWAKH